MYILQIHSLLDSLAQCLFFFGGFFVFHLFIIPFWLQRCLGSFVAKYWVNFAANLAWRLINKS